jgi:Sulfotransferase domain
MDHMISRIRQQTDRLSYNNNSNNSNNNSNSVNSNSSWRFSLFRSLQLWLLLALTSWAILQFLLVARLAHGSSGDHQQPLTSILTDEAKASRKAALREVQEQHRLRAAKEKTETTHVLSVTLNEDAHGDDDDEKEGENAQDENEDEHASVDESEEDEEDDKRLETDSAVVNQWIPKVPPQLSDDIVQYNCTNEDGQLITMQQVPAFIIIGAQKAGTSALYDLLNLHPQVQGSLQPEVHFFDRRLPIDFLKNATNATWADAYRCKVREIYAKKFFPYQQLENNPHLKFFDKTPAYITSKGAPFRVHAIAPWSKIVLSLRNPVHRAFSQHRMEWMPHQPHLTFEERLAVSLDVLKRVKRPIRYADSIPDTDPFIRPSRELMRHNTTKELEKIDDGFEIWKSRNLIHRGFYLEQLQPWLEYYTLGKNLLVVRYEEFNNNPEAVLGQILDFVGVERPPPGTIYNDNVLSQPYGPGRMRDSPGAMGEVPPPAPGSFEFLTQLYKPYNDQLADVLGEEWRGVWD